MAQSSDDRRAHGGTFLAEGVGGLLDGLTAALKADRFEGLTDGAITAGHWGLLAVAVLGFLIQLVGTAVHGFSAFVVGVGWLVALPLLQYVAVQFLDTTRSMVATNGTPLGSQAFLRAYALVALVAGIVSLVLALGRGIDAGSLQVFLYGLGMAALCLATAWLALNPSLLGIRVNARTNAGEEAIGVLSFFVKTGVRLVPIFYGVAFVVGAVHGLLVLLGMVGDSQFQLAQAVMRAEMSAPLLIWAALSPLVAYVGFVVFFLAIDLMQAILSIPGSVGGGSGGGASKKKAAASRPARKKRAASTSASKKKASGSSGSGGSGGSGDSGGGSSA